MRWTLRPTWVLITGVSHRRSTLLATSARGFACSGHLSTASNPTPLSDVDIALVADCEVVPKERLKMMLDIGVELAERCGVRNADVRIINDAPLVFRGRVVCDGYLLYARDEATRVEFETRTRDAYFDFLPTHRSLQDAFFADVRARGLHGRQG